MQSNKYFNTYYLFKNMDCASVLTSQIYFNLCSCKRLPSKSLLKFVFFFIVLFRLFIFALTRCNLCGPKWKIANEKEQKQKRP